MDSGRWMGGWVDGKYMGVWKVDGRWMGGW